MLVLFCVHDYDLKLYRICICYMTCDTNKNITFKKVTRKQCLSMYLAAYTVSLFQKDDFCGFDLNLMRIYEKPYHLSVFGIINRSKRN